MQKGMLRTYHRTPWQNKWYPQGSSMLLEHKISWPTKMFADVIIALNNVKNVFRFYGKVAKFVQYFI